MSLTFADAVSYLSRFINYERQPGVAYSRDTFDLGGFERFLAQLDNPHQSLKTVLVAGTKGKGSTAAMIASIAQASGLKAGLYTSPHLCSIRERVRVNGQLISEDAFAALVTELLPLIEASGLGAARRYRTFFEILTALALMHFADGGVDVAVLEVGVGGRLDSTNVVRPLVSVITPISLDHTDLLGDTIPLIAAEKAGIIKAGGTVVTAPQPPEALAVIRSVCAEQGAHLRDVGREVRWHPRRLSSEGSVFDLDGGGRSYPQLEIPLAGPHQILNAATAVATVEQLAAQGLSISLEGTRTGLRQVQWEGRLETVSQRPWIVLDGAHNRDSARRIGEALRICFQYRRLILVLGISANKDLEGIVAELAPLATVAIATRAEVPRAAQPQRLAELATKWTAHTLVEEDTREALARAIAEAQAGDLILVTGSLYLVGDAKRLFPDLLAALPAAMPKPGGL
ncbi:MAG: bifunctional folylpolyglutamate synthase/dihydrofolate synthase [Nitrospinae bacterium]|nr:bifunctional folylpolyglutamate synthase/dihydrofolate synthase [Nitrospinota bacterium]